MKITFYTTLTLLLFSLASCGNHPNKKNDATTQVETEISYLEGYFTKNNISFTNETKEIVLTSKAAFDSYFAVGKTMNNKISPTDFSKNNYLAIITKPSATAKQIEVTTLEKNAQEVKLSYTLKTGEEQSYVSNDLKIIEIPNSCKIVKFVSGKKSNMVSVTN